MRVYATSCSGLRQQMHQIVRKLDASINAARKPIELSVSPFDPL